MVIAPEKLSLPTHGWVGVSRTKNIDPTPTISKLMLNLLMVVSRQ
jgi:hypothetical protein